MVAPRVDINAWIDEQFAGLGVAIRYASDDPVDGEPLVSLAMAKEITRRAIERGTMKKAEAINAVRIGSGDVYGEPLVEALASLGILIIDDAETLRHSTRMQAEYFSRSFAPE